jgi:hypothetical protein
MAYFEYILCIFKIYFHNELKVPYLNVSKLFFQFLT